MINDLVLSAQLVMSLKQVNKKRVQVNKKRVICHVHSYSMKLSFVAVDRGVAVISFILF